MVLTAAVLLGYRLFCWVELPFMLLDRSLGSFEITSAVGLSVILLPEQHDGASRSTPGFVYAVTSRRLFQMNNDRANL